MTKRLLIEAARLVIFVIRFPNERYLDDGLRPKFPKAPKIMIGGAISLELKGPLIIFEKEMTNKRNNVDSKCYANYVVPQLTQFYNEQRVEIQSCMGLENNTYPDNQPLLLQDNASMYTTGITKAALTQSGIELAPPFPPCSPDLNPIKGVWVLLKRCINSQRPRPTTHDDIKEAIIEE